MPTRRERERLAAEPKQDDGVDPAYVLAWLASLGTMWRETSDEGRRQLALATFMRISVAAGPERASHRIVSLEMTEEDREARTGPRLSGLLEVKTVGDTGLCGHQLAMALVTVGSIAETSAWNARIQRGLDEERKCRLTQSETLV